MNDDSDPAPAPDDEHDYDPGGDADFGRPQDPSADHSGRNLAVTEASQGSTEQEATENRPRIRADDGPDRSVTAEAPPIHEGCDQCEDPDEPLCPTGLDVLKGRSELWIEQAKQELGLKDSHDENEDRSRRLNTRGEMA